MKFRKLKANEIECRVATIKNTGVQLLLYKDARVDMAILDESDVIWQRDHKSLKDNIYCGIGIYNEDIKQWVWKWDAGSESFTEKVKGEASDSFKRAGFNCGIGRELYTAPFIWVRPNSDDEIICTNPDEKMSYKKKYKLKYGVKFNVVDVEYRNDIISYVEIHDQDGKVRYKFGKIKLIMKDQIEMIENSPYTDEQIQQWVAWFNTKDVESLSYRNAQFIISKIPKKEDE